MNIEVEIDINAMPETIWNAISDIENCAQMISGIIKVNVLDKPEGNLVGLKWEETRMMFGKEATETMWITEAEKNKYYQTQAESHGSVYISKMSLKPQGSTTKLIMTFESHAQTLITKIMSFFMGGLIKGSMKKMVLQDLQDIKKHVESG